MAQNPTLDIAREWLLDAIRETPAIIDGMSESDLDQALNLLGVNVDPTVAFAQINDDAHDQHLPKEADDDALRLLELIQECDLDSLSEADLDKALATLGIDIAPTLQLVSGNTSIPISDSSSLGDPEELDLGPIATPSLAISDTFPILSEQRKKLCAVVTGAAWFGKSSFAAMVIKRRQRDLNKGGFAFAAASAARRYSFLPTIHDQTQRMKVLESCYSGMYQPFDGHVVHDNGLAAGGFLPTIHDQAQRMKVLESFSTLGDFGATDLLDLSDILKMAPRPTAAAIVQALRGIDQAQLANSHTRPDGDLCIAVTEGLDALMADFKGHNAAGNVIALLLLEFRRHMHMRDNGFGTAALGETVKGGRHYLDPTVRSIYSAILDKWLGVNQGPIVIADCWQSASRRCWRPATSGTSNTQEKVKEGMEKAMKTAEELMAFSQGNLEAMIRSGQVWASGTQDIGKQIAANAQASFDETMSTFKALTSAKSLKDAFDLQATLARTTLEKTLAESGKLTDASMKLTEQTLAPLTARVTLAMEKFAKAS